MAVLHPRDAVAEAIATEKVPKRRRSLHAMRRNVSLTARSNVRQTISALPAVMQIPAVRLSVEVLFVGVN